MVNKTRKELTVIYRKEIIQDITLFTSAPKAKFYSELFMKLNVSDFPKELPEPAGKDIPSKPCFALLLL